MYKLSLAIMAFMGIFFGLVSVIVGIVLIDTPPELITIAEVILLVGPGYLSYANLTGFCTLLLSYVTGGDR